MTTPQVLRGGALLTHFCESCRRAIECDAPGPGTCACGAAYVVVHEPSLAPVELVDANVDGDERSCIVRINNRQVLTISVFRPETGGAWQADIDGLTNEGHIGAYGSSRAKAFTAAVKAWPGEPMPWDEIGHQVEEAGLFV